MNTPLWMRHSFHAMLIEVGGNGPVTLRVAPRHDVATGRWVELSWTGDDEREHEVSGSSMEIVLRRAAQREASAREEYDARQAREATTPTDSGQGRGTVTP